MARKILLPFMIIATILFSISIVQAQDEYPTDDDVNAIAKKLYCPVCPNTPLDVCETVACQDWREEIAMQLSEGWTEEEVIAYFSEQYGERVLAEPERRGFTSLVWILPVVAVLMGTIVVGQVLKSWRTGGQVGSATIPDRPEISQDTLAHIEKELEDLT